MAPFDTREAKVTHALITMGSSILNAGGSTLLGTLFLARSDSVVFRTFFIFMWGTIFLGLFSGLAFAPIVLSLIGPLEAPEMPRSKGPPPPLTLPPPRRRADSQDYY
jgi:predicted RND superfamily exporter protein